MECKQQHTPSPAAGRSSSRSYAKVLGVEALPVKTAGSLQLEGAKEGKSFRIINGIMMLLKGFFLYFPFLSFLFFFGFFILRRCSAALPWLRRRRSHAPLSAAAPQLLRLLAPLPPSSLLLPPPPSSSLLSPQSFTRKGTAPPVPARAWSERGREEVPRASNFTWMLIGGIGARGYSKLVNKGGKSSLFRPGAVARWCVPADSLEKRL